MKAMLLSLLARLLSRNWVDFEPIRERANTLTLYITDAARTSVVIEIGELEDVKVRLSAHPCCGTHVIRCDPGHLTVIVGRYTAAFYHGIDTVLNNDEPTLAHAATHYPFAAVKATVPTGTQVILKTHYL